jgi:hypothetical protein
VPVGSGGTASGGNGSGGNGGGAAGGGAVGAAGGGGALPTRRLSSGGYGASEAPAVSGASPASEAPVADDAYPGTQSATLPLERPPLPKRQSQPGAAAQSFDDQSFDDDHPFENRAFDNHRDELGGTANRVTEPPADQMTGLMADFLRGVSRAEEEDSPARD